MERYWRRRKYGRLRSGVANKDNAKISVTKRSRRPKFWKINVTRKLRLSSKIGSSSIMQLKRLRDAYVEMMFCFAGRVMQLNTGNVRLVKKVNTPN